MSKDNRWEVHTQIESGSDGYYEICAIRKDYELGHLAIGWDEADKKIILFGTNHNPIKGDTKPTKEEIKKAKQITQGLCDILNIGWVSNTVVTT